MARRKRLEILGPTYIKLGQILSLRENILPVEITRELKNLLARLQPRRLIRELCDYTMREVDLRLEADNAEVFAANFEDEPDIVFPHIYREYTTRNLIVMEFLDGFKPSDPRAEVKAFRRNVEDVCRRWQRTANFSEFSIGRLILESVSRGVVHRMYFPVEMVLMVKAIVTFEGVGNYLKPGFDVATVSRSHINRLFLSQFSPLRVAREGLRGAPELVDALVKAPMLVTEGLRVLESTTRRPPQNPFTGIRGTIFAGFALVAGATSSGSVVTCCVRPWPSSG